MVVECRVSRLFFQKAPKRLQKVPKMAPNSKNLKFSRKSANFENFRRTFLNFCPFLPKNMAIFCKIQQNFGKSEKHQIGAEQNLVPEIFRWHLGTSKSTQSGAKWHHLETLDRKFLKISLKKGALLFIIVR